MADKGNLQLKRRSVNLGDVSALTFSPLELKPLPPRFLSRYPEMVGWHEQFQSDLKEYHERMTTSFNQALAAKKG